MIAATLGESSIRQSGDRIAGDANGGGLGNARELTKQAAEDHNKRLPLDIQMQSIWLPAIGAQSAVDTKNPALP
jgi:hypothetical protein